MQEMSICFKMHNGEMLHDGPFRWVWRLHKELEPSTRAAVRGPEGPLMGATPAELIWGQFLLQHPPA